MCTSSRMTPIQNAEGRNQTRTGAGKSEEYIKSKTREWVREYRTRELWLGLEALGIQGLGTQLARHNIEQMETD